MYILFCSSLSFFSSSRQPRPTTTHPSLTIPFFPVEFILPARAVLWYSCKPPHWGEKTARVITTPAFWSLVLRSRGGGGGERARRRASRAIAVKRCRLGEGAPQLRAPTRTPRTLNCSTTTQPTTLPRLTASPPALHPWRLPKEERERAAQESTRSFVLRHPTNHLRARERAVLLPHPQGCRPPVSWIDLVVVTERMMARKRNIARLSPARRLPHCFFY